jgi:maltose/moltooligosaccharide transporter
MIFFGNTGKLPNWVYASFFLGSILSIGSIWWSMRTTPEIEPSAEELAHMKSSSNGGIFRPFMDIFSAIKYMPKIMWQLGLVYMFQWYALFCYWQNASKSVALSVFNATPENKNLYEEAVSWTGLVNGWYNLVTAVTAFILVGYAKKYSPKSVHMICLILAAIGLLCFPFISNKYLLLFAITGFGIGWASMMGIPYLIVVNKIPKERYGVYMGIINMMIVIPMIIQNVTFGSILQYPLKEDPRNAIIFAGIFLLIAAFFTFRMSTSDPKVETTFNKANV